MGQALGLPAAMTLYSFIGVAVTSASVVLFGAAVWDPVVLLGKLNQPVRVAVTGTTVGAGIYETMELLGKDRVQRRLAHALGIIAQMGT